MASHSTWDCKAQGLPLERSPAVFFFCMPSEERQTEIGDMRQPLYTPEQGETSVSGQKLPPGKLPRKKTKNFGFFCFFLVFWAN